MPEQLPKTAAECRQLLEQDGVDQACLDALKEHLLLLEQQEQQR